MPESPVPQSPDEPPHGDPATDSQPAPPAGSTSGQATAAAAVDLLVRDHGFILPTSEQRTHVAMAFAGARKVVYGQAFDVLRVKEGVDIDWSDLDSVRANLADVTLYEVKSTNRSLPDDFTGYFFSLSTAELLVAQSLGEQFRFAFVALANATILDLTLREVYHKTKAIYPSWSIRF